MKELIAKLGKIKFAGILHRDIIPRNILINEGIIKLIDLSWAGENEDYKNFPGRLGTDYRKYPGFDDRYSLYKSLEYIGGIQ
uniref:Protein kinase domain-containing protein n=1 Tax=viral metagenome TaxID=1070528 RepID=A0A6M3M2A6_9ZZZZ